VTAQTALNACKPSPSLIIVKEGEVRLMRRKGHDLARVNARRERCVCHDMTEGEVRLMRREDHDLARVNARRERCIGHDITEGEVHLMRPEGPDLA
jgi:hypothetical protein